MKFAESPQSKSIEQVPLVLFGVFDEEELFENKTPKFNKNGQLWKSEIQRNRIKSVILW